MVLRVVLEGGQRRGKRGGIWKMERERDGVGVYFKISVGVR